MLHLLLLIETSEAADVVTLKPQKLLQRSHWNRRSRFHGHIEPANANYQMIFSNFLVNLKPFPNQL
jgi:hypothetical protein